MPCSSARSTASEDGADTAESIGSPAEDLFAMLILSFYGGGFLTVPAYLKDLFGSFQVGAIHGRRLTAWSAAHRLVGGRGARAVDRQRRRRREEGSYCKCKLLLDKKALRGGADSVPE